MKLGFIGTGNMAGAIMGGIIKKGIIAPEEIIGSDIMEAGREHAKKEHGIHVTADNIEVTQKAEVLVLSVKPQFYAQTIAEIKDAVRKVKIVRTMPNTPALVGEGMTAACPNDAVTEEEKNYALELLSSFGKVEIVPEHLIDAVVAVSGSSPAYIFMFIEAMADGAVAEGMPRSQAYQFAAQAVLGSAKMVLETGKHPGELKDMVCSPAGTTIEAVRVLEKLGFRSAVIEAEKVCADMSRNM